MEPFGYECIWNKDGSIAKIVEKRSLAPSAAFKSKQSQRKVQRELAAQKSRPLPSPPTSIKTRPPPPASTKKIFLNK